MKENAELKAAGLGWEDLPSDAQFMDRASGQRSIDLGFEVELLTETFYYLAESVRTMMKGTKARKGKEPPPPHRSLAIPATSASHV